jgi:short-subunit dehydrogenase
VTLLLLLAIAAYNVYRHFYQWLRCKPEFRGKVVLVTGGSSGIGEQLAKRFVELGAAKVIIAARTLRELERVKSECADPSRVQVLQLDLSKPEEVLKTATEALKGVRVDILVNNGGLSMREEFCNMEFSTCQYMMNTNCMSHIALVKALLPQMIAGKQGASIVNILSISGLMGIPVRTMYCASKFAMDGFSKSLRSEVKSHGINVT